jgi:hypothetical protein
MPDNASCDFVSFVGVKVVTVQDRQFCLNVKISFVRLHKVEISNKFGKDVNQNISTIIKRLIYPSTVGIGNNIQN